VTTELTSDSKQTLPQEWDLNETTSGTAVSDEDLAARLDRLEQRLDAFESTCYTFLLYAKQLSDRTVSFFEDIFGLSRNDLAQIHDRLGVNANNKGDYPRAIESFKKLVDLNRTASACYKLGVAYDNNGDLQEAIEAFRGAIELDATLLDAHYKLAEVYSRMENFGEAVRCLTRASEVDDQNAESCRSLSLLPTGLAFTTMPWSSTSARERSTSAACTERSLRTSISEPSTKRVTLSMTSSTRSFRRKCRTLQYPSTRHARSKNATPLSLR